MARVQLADVAVEDLDELILTHSLPRDARPRVARSISSLERFPRIGHPVAETPFRFVLGPWRWLLIVYVYDEDEDVVTIVTMQDARRATSVTSRSR